VPVSIFPRQYLLQGRKELLTAAPRARNDADGRSGAVVSLDQSNGTAVAEKAT